MTKQKTGPVAVSQGLYVLWVIGVIVGLGIAGEWIILGLFSLGILLVQGAAAIWTEHREAQRMEREK